jgi:nucleoside-diphosphate-sugar epimerase
LIYVSSCILYDRSDPAVKGELAGLSATTPYARAKLEGELQALTVPSALIMRIPSPVGERMRPGTVLPRFVGQALRGQRLELWGTGGREQDFVHVEDLGDFVLRAIWTAAGGTVNVASGQPVTMRRLAETIVAIVGRGSVVFSARVDPLDGETARYDTQLARGRFGWAPAIDLEVMIRRLAAGGAIDA